MPAGGRLTQFWHSDLCQKNRSCNIRLFQRLQEQFRISGEGGTLFPILFQFFFARAVSSGLVHKPMKNLNLYVTRRATPHEAIQFTLVPLCTTCAPLVHQVCTTVICGREQSERPTTRFARSTTLNCYTKLSAALQQRCAANRALNDPGVDRDSCQS